MKRTTITLPEDLAALVEREAVRRRTSVSEIVRISLRAQLRGAGRRDIPWTGLVDDPELVRGAEIDEALEETWVNDLTRDRR